MGPKGLNHFLNVIISIINFVSKKGFGGAPSTSYIETIDPNLAERSLPQYPNLPGTLDQLKSEEIRRTVYVSNLDPRIQFAHLYELFSQVGEICYIRLTTGSDQLNCNNLGLSSLAFTDENANFSEMSMGAYIEFSEQPMVVKALCLNGLSFADRHIKVNHATSSIIIPATNKQKVTVEDIRKEISKLRNGSSSHHRSDRDRDRDRERDRDRDRHRDRDRDTRDRDTDRHKSSRDHKDRDDHKERDRDRERVSSRHKEPSSSSKKHKSSGSGTGASARGTEKSKREGSVESSHTEEEDEENMQTNTAVNETGSYFQNKRLFKSAEIYFFNLYCIFFNLKVKSPAQTHLLTLTQWQFLHQRKRAAPVPSPNPRQQAKGARPRRDHPEPLNLVTHHHESAPVDPGNENHSEIVIEKESVKSGTAISETRSVRRRKKRPHLRPIIAARTSPSLPATVM